MGAALFSGSMVWLRIVLPGLAWVWVLPNGTHTTHSRFTRMLVLGAATSMIGVLLTGLSTLACGEAEVYTRPVDIYALLATVVTGLFLGFICRRRQLLAILLDALPINILLLAGTIFILLLPHRGAWIAGGWDPGVYAGQAVALSNSGTFYPDDSFFYDLFSEEEQRAFTRTGNGRTERFPAVVVQPEKKRFTFEFFKFTPALFAAIHRAGGMNAMLRANTIIAMLLAPCFFALILNTLGIAAAGFATLILVTQPIFLYHTHWPLTEPTQLLLICGILFTSMLPARPGSTLLASLFILAAVFNRFSFLPFFGVFMVCLALGKARQREHLPVIYRHLLFIAVAGIAAFINYQIAPTSLRGWSDARLIIVFSICAGSLALLLDVVLSWKFIITQIDRLKPLHIDLAATAFLVLLITSWLMRSHIGRSSDMTNLQRLIPFTGTLAMLLAAGGCLALLFRRPRLKAEIFFPLCLFLLSAAWLMILRKSIVDWFPWATRRYYQTLLPWLAVAGGYLLSTVFSIQPRRWRWAGRILAGSLLLLHLIEIAPTSWRAWRYTSHNGLDQQMTEIADQVGPHDIIIADHPKWGTPLALVHGVKVLNGMRGWSDKSGKTMQTMVSAFTRLEKEGWNIFFLTSTRGGMDIYPLESKHVTLEHVFHPYEHQTIIQHKRADHYALDTSTTQFRIYRFLPMTYGEQNGH
jgi:hypothetical protein